MNEDTIAGISCLSILAIVCICIFVPLSFSYVEYWEYGLNQRRSTGKVKLDRVYDAGRYSTGIDHKFITYQADAHFIHLDELEVFSAGTSESNESIGLDFKVDVDITYLLIQEEVGELHQELADSYDDVVESRAKDAIKNEAIFITFTEYFQQRQDVEQRFRIAVQNRWNIPPKLHVRLDQFHLGRIRIPQSVARKQLESRVQNERNDMEAFNQQGQLERQVTAVEVNSIQLEQDQVLRTANAEASLIRARADVEQDRIIAEAQNNGAQQLFVATNITTESDMTKFTYWRTLQKRVSTSSNFGLSVSYLTSENVIKTTSG